MTFRRNRTDNDDDTDEDSNYYAISPGMSYMLTTKISLNLSLDYSEYHYENDNRPDREQFRGRLAISIGWPRLLSGK